MANKSRLLFLLKYLYENTDEDHPMTTAELRDILKDSGFTADLRTIRDDAAMLLDAGFDVLINEKNGHSTTYSYGTHEWEPVELKILIDAVSSAQFLSKRKTQQLIEKLAVLSGKQNVERLTPTININDAIKAPNNHILYIVEKAEEGIRTNRKISFKYYQYNIRKEQIQRRGGSSYHVSPYATLWQNDRYYLVGFSDERNKVVAFRADRMGIPKLMEEERLPAPGGFRLQDYATIITRMFDGEHKAVSLRCRMDLADAVIDKFGKNIRFFDVTEDAFSVTVPVAVSCTFFSWVFQYGGGILIQYPEDVCKKYEAMLSDVLKGMKNREVTSAKG